MYKESFNDPSVKTLTRRTLSNQALSDTRMLRNQRRTIHFPINLIFKCISYPVSLSVNKGQACYVADRIFSFLFFLPCGWGQNSSDANGVINLKIKIKN